MSRAGLLERVLPLLFVALWSTGFLGARGAMPHAEALSFLTVRFALAAAILGGFAWLTGARRLSGRAFFHSSAVGLLIHAAYLGGVFSAVRGGVPAGLAALIVSLQPILTALLAGSILGERIAARQWLGFVLGLAGAVLVLSERADFGSALAFRDFGWTQAGLCVFALLGIVGGTLWQKRFGGGADIRTGTAAQYLSALAACGLGAMIWEDWRIEWDSPALWFSLAWLTLVLSVGTVPLLMFLIRRGRASSVASLFYMVPPTTAGFAFLLFGEVLGARGLAGFALATLGVALATRDGSSGKGRGEVRPKTAPPAPKTP